MVKPFSLNFRPYSVSMLVSFMGSLCRSKQTFSKTNPEAGKVWREKSNSGRLSVLNQILAPGARIWLYFSKKVQEVNLFSRSRFLGQGSLKLRYKRLTEWGGRI